MHLPLLDFQHHGLQLTPDLINLIPGKMRKQIWLKGLGVCVWPHAWVSHPGKLWAWTFDAWHAQQVISSTKRPLQIPQVWPRAQMQVGNCNIWNERSSFEACFSPRSLIIKTWYWRGLPWHDVKGIRRRQHLLMAGTIFNLDTWVLIALRWARPERRVVILEGTWVGFEENPQGTSPFRIICWVPGPPL